MGWQEFPMITCPYCDKESQIDDYCNLESGDTIECAKCEKTFFIKYTEWVLSADIQPILPIKGD